VPKDKRGDDKKERRTQKQQLGNLPNTGNLYETGEELGRQQYQQQYQKQYDSQEMQKKKGEQPDKES